MGPFEAPEAEGEFDLAHGPGGLRTRRQRGGRRFGPKKNGDFHGILWNGYDWKMVDNDVESAILMVI